MCTDRLLSKLRCAECRQIKVAQFSDVAAKASLIALGSFFIWYLFPRSTERDDQAGEEAPIHAAGQSPELIANRRRA
jgi:3'-phosphoadenosine 5'-phosphosulfate (PAPS) 3'-phosphatase